MHFRCTFDAVWMHFRCAFNVRWIAVRCGEEGRHRRCSCARGNEQRKGDCRQDKPERVHDLPHARTHSRTESRHQKYSCLYTNVKPPWCRRLSCKPRAGEPPAPRERLHGLSVFFKEIVACRPPVWYSSPLK